jgi:hypothetical protein
VCEKCDCDGPVVALGCNSVCYVRAWDFGAISTPAQAHKATGVSMVNLSTYYSGQNCEDTVIVTHLGRHLNMVLCSHDF